MNYENIDFPYNEFENKLLNSDLESNEIDYDPEFIQLETMVSLKAEQQYGETIISPLPIDWSSALNKAYDLLDKSKDYRLCCIITRALTHKYGVRGTLKGIETIRLLTERFWQQAFPTTIFDGEIDLFPRANAIAELNSSTGLVGDLRNTEITLGSVGKITLSRLEKILSGRSDNTDFSRHQILQILHDEILANNSEIQAITLLVNELTALENLFSELFGSDQAPNLDQLNHLLCSINISHENNIENQNRDANEIAVDSSTSLMPINPAMINSRNDAIKLLDKICEFLERNDPANPAPLLIKRARNMVGQDFYTILNQLAPDAVAQAEHITGSQF